MTLFRTVSCALALFTLTLQTAMAHDGWRRFVDPAYGTAASYPAHIFRPQSADPARPGRTFLSADGRAKMAIGGWFNADNESLGAFKRRLLNDGKHDHVTYQPRGRRWFVLSGYRGGDIYYEKVIYSCGRRVVNAFGISYPVELRWLYDPIVERMEDSFRAGWQCRRAVPAD